MICPQYLGCPSHGAKFTKMGNCHFCGADGMVAYNTAPSHLISGHSRLFHFISYVMSCHIIWHDMCHVMLSYIMSYFLPCVICGMPCHVILYPCHASEVISYMLQCDYITVTADARHLINAYYLFIYLLFMSKLSCHIMLYYVRGFILWHVMAYVMCHVTHHVIHHAICHICIRYYV